jgi:tight adherence protein B
VNPAILIIVGGIVLFIMGLGLIGILFYRDYAKGRTLDERLDRLAPTSLEAIGDVGILKEPMYPEETTSWWKDFVPEIPSLQTMFEQAHFRYTPAQFWAMSGGVALAGFAIPFFVPQIPWELGSPILAAIFGVAPFFYVRRMRKKRLAKFAAQLCEALELVARALRAGHSLAAGMNAVREEMPEPISSEFGRVYEEQNLGISLEAAMRNLADRMPNLDLKFFVTAVIIQRQTGGDLAEILDKIGYVIRERYKILGMVQALTAEGRLSGIVLTALPFLLVATMHMLNPQYVRPLYMHPTGQLMSIIGIIMIVVGAVVIRWIVKIKI